MINADPQELAKFSELAHRWWDTEGDFRPLHEINPLRLDWIDALRAAERQARRSTSAAAAASSPTRWRGAAPTCSASTSSTKPLKVAQLHAIEAGDAADRVPRGRGRGAGRRAARQASTSSPAWRCSSTCPIRRPIVAACARAASSRAAGSSSRRINRNAKAFLFAIVGAEHVLKLLPKGTHEYAQVHPPERAVRAGAARPGSRRRRLAAWNTTR